MTSEERLPTAAKRQRIAKAIARAGLCSRRDAEAWIVAGRVSVNGEILTSPALDVAPTDAILVDGTPLPAAEKTRLFLFHKPRGLVTSDHDPEGRATVADYLRAHWPEGPRVVTIGRLDINTEGLLLLTNDGGLARTLELPQTGWVRRYRVRAKGTADAAALDALADGVTIDGIAYAGIEAKLDRVQGANVWLSMGLREGKNREVKRVLEHLGLEVNRLIRLSFGPFQLLDLPEGAVEEVRTRVLRDQLGDKLAAAAGADFGTQEPAPGARQNGREPRGAHESTRPREPRPPHRQTRSAERDLAPHRGDRRDERRDAPPPKRERPTAGPRKHVSALRSDDARRTGPRKRVERIEVQDRQARTVRVERLVATHASDTPRPRGDRSGPNATAARGGRGGDRRYDERRTGPRHASPAAEGKQARVARSGARTAARDDDRPARSRDAAERPDRRRERDAKPAQRRDGETRARRPNRDEGRAPGTKPGASHRGRRNARAPTRGAAADDRRAGERPSASAADRKRPADRRGPSSAKPRADQAKPRPDRAKPGAHRVKPRAHRAKPPRDPSKPRR